MVRDSFFHDGGSELALHLLAVILSFDGHSALIGYTFETGGMGSEREEKKILKKLHPKV